MSRSLNRRASSPQQRPEEIVEAPTAAADLPARKKRVSTIPAFPADNDAVPDFAAELEAALMNDLQAVSSIWSDEDDQPENDARLSAEPLDIDQADADFRGDRLAFETLIRRGSDRSQTDRRAIEGPRRERLNAEAATAEPDARQSEIPDAEQAPPTYRRPVPVRQRIERRAPSPVLPHDMPEADADSGGRWVEPIDDEAPAVPAGAISRLNRGLIAIAAVTLLVGGGAFVTLQSVKARTEQPAGGVVDPAPAVAAAPLLVAPPSSDSSRKASYDRAAADESLPEAPQLRGADLTSVSPVQKNTVAATPSVAQPVVTASPDPSPVAVDHDPATALTIPGDSASGSVTSDAGSAAPPAPKPAPAPAIVAALSPSTVKKPSLPAGAINGPAVIASAVRLRASPDNNAATVNMLKAGMTVEVVRCKGWCEIIASGQHGYVFQKFLGPAKITAGKTTGLF